MALFKKIPDFGELTESPVDFGSTDSVFAAVTPEYVVTWFWPTMIGLVVAFWLSLIGFRDMSRFAAVITCIAQATFMAVAS